MAIFIDTNVPIYSGGRPHRLRDACSAVLAVIGEQPESFVTDTEVLQEILHVYLARRLWPSARIVFDGFAALMSGRIAPMLPEDAIGAADLADELPRLQARDLIHLAVMQRLGVTRVISADTGFDGVAGIERLDPARLEEWRASLSELA